MSDYARLKTELFDVSCVKCHGPTRRAGGVDVSTFALIMSEEQALVVKGRSADSFLFQVIESGEMPKGNLTVSAALKTALACWIDAGASETSATGCFE